MTMLWLLIPLSIALALLALVAFLWSLKENQYDDPDGAAARILHDDDSPRK